MDRNNLSQIMVGNNGWILEIFDSRVGLGSNE
jgi:hypothetical protein